MTADSIRAVELVQNDLRFPALMAGDGEPVILLHGFPDCHHNWQHQLVALAEAGYYALAPALRGYHPDCQPADRDYSLYAAVEDLCSMARQLGGRVHLVGHDWGAAVGYLACARSPEYFASFSALAIPPLGQLPGALLKVPEQLWLSAYMEFFQLPLVPDWWLQRNNFAGVETLWQRWSPGWDGGDHLQQAKDVLAQPGVLTAALGWYRHLCRLWTSASRETLRWLRQPIEVPVQCLLGRKDGCMSARLLEHCSGNQGFPAGLKVETLAGAGHFLHLERPDRVNELLLRHLSGR